MFIVRDAWYAVCFQRIMQQKKRRMSFGFFSDPTEEQDIQWNEEYSSDDYDTDDDYSVADGYTTDGTENEDDSDNSDLDGT